jgi:hypothetical protein
MLLNGASIKRCKPMEQMKIIENSSMLYYYCCIRTRDPNWIINKFCGLELVIFLFLYSFTHHKPDKLEIFCISHFANVIEENWKLCEINGKRNFGKDPLDFHLKKFYDLICIKNLSKF